MRRRDWISLLATGIAIDLMAATAFLYWHKKRARNGIVRVKVGT